MSVGVGFTLQPDEATLALVSRVAARADYFEIAPETLWYEDESGALLSNGFHERFLALKRASDAPFVAHGVGFSLGSGDPGEDARRLRWLERMRIDHALFELEWWTDHGGATSLAGEALTLPMPLPFDAHAARVLRRQLRAMQRVVPDVGVENSAMHFVFGDPLDEPTFLRHALREHGHHLLLDLHNLHAMSLNLDFDPRAWLARCELGDVIEIHVSGGAESDPRWLPSRRSVRLDGHDGAVPEEVWSLLDECLPRCLALRGVTLERMEGTVHDASEARALGEELERIRSAIDRAGRG